MKLIVSGLLMVVVVAVLLGTLSSTTLQYTKIQRKELTQNRSLLMLTLSFLIATMLQLYKYSKRKIVFTLLLLINAWWLFYKKIIIAEDLPLYQSVILWIITAVLLSTITMQPQKGKKAIWYGIVAVTIVYCLILLPEYPTIIDTSMFTIQQPNTIERENIGQKESRSEITITNTKTRETEKITPWTTYYRTGNNYQISYATNNTGNNPATLITNKGVVASIMPQTSVIFEEKNQKKSTIEITQGSVYRDSVYNTNLQIKVGKTTMSLPTPCFTQYINTIQTIDFNHGSGTIVQQDGTTIAISSWRYVQWTKTESPYSRTKNWAIEKAKETYNIQRENYFNWLNTAWSRSSIGYDIIKVKLMILWKYNAKYRDQLQQRHKLGCFNHQKDCDRIHSKEILGNA